MRQMEFENVKLNAKAKVYFDGKVLSHTFFMPNGDCKTLGIAFPGEYDFGTEDAEIMEVVAGTLYVLHPDKTEWEAYGGGDWFKVPANSRFRLRCDEISEYVCSYIKG